MAFLGNILWLLLGGFVCGLSWLLAGCLWCITIVGIPIGMQCFKFAKLTFSPFGKVVVPGGGVGSMVLNIFWILLSGLPLAIEAVTLGCLMYITIVGIPFGKQYFKIAGLAISPFGAQVRG